MKYSTEAKVGFFAFLIIVILFWATVRVSDRSAVSGGGYDVSFNVDSASGLKTKAPVELAGVAVGVVKGVELVDSTRAKVFLRINDHVQLRPDTQVKLRTRGYLGETFVEIIPGTQGEGLIKEGDTLSDATRSGDINQLVGKFTEIADDIKVVTANLRTMSSGEDAPINRIIMNLDRFTEEIKNVTVRNTDNIDRIAENVADLSDQLKHIVADNRQNVDESMDQINSITKKIDHGQGTIGKLLNDDETVNKLNDSLDGLSDTLGGYKSLETEIGFHTEYLTNSKDFKNYVSLGVRPVPDKAILIDLSTDPDPNPTHTVRTTDITAGGATTTVTADTATTNRDAFRFSVQLAKDFYDFTIRGGLIESKGGVGVDYKKGPIGVKFSAFDFSSRYGQKPHLKVLGDINMTRNLFVLGGADDMLNPNQKTDYFFGAGFRFVDDDLKKLARFSNTASVFGK
ncbi:MAG: MCE family protein [Deltaproteobacteria bacterium]|nr:MCE family protein [Deltaproteobacteria bacterium]